ncbi:DUF3575 domain-containing protein [Chryseobacterium shandongense]|uniref:DUF3575 domain-containing protein n=1 Tax=Chryseobacterium shandongense TaxID=1493872 RepID=A0AAD1DL92_9FLAO|nr:DUF3575 domain-containing protein [Chryseobacterium shandongense]AZA86571.1 DUF3575 domain-containing protein [Chryseobacterium shandongense]AZA94983.1 DUF3575 domain-containing protein [Chryseobacterium shandongense]
MKIRLLAGALLLFILGNVDAQEQNNEKSVYVKGNALFIPIGIVNLALEHQISKKITVQGDVFVSPWKSFDGHELQYYSVSAEGRYYFNEAFRHFYVGANIATSAFTLQKWNYWPDEPYYNDYGEVFKSSNLYQKGYSLIIGVTLGYQFKVSDRWNIDLYGTLGTSQDFYKGYDRTTGERYDRKDNKFNRSGEILPYRGGVMISYKLK